MPRGAVPFPFGNCRVCNAQATGNHYGANTCEGCKGFFKRSLGKAEKYKCLNNEMCAIEPENRIKCKLCRFKRCLDLGMSMNAIKMGRIPKVQKQKALDVEKAVQEPTKDMAFIDSRDMYRNSNLQSSPPLMEHDIEPPKRKQLKSSNSNSSVTTHCHGQVMSDVYHEQAPDSLYGNHSKQPYPMDTQDMVQLLHDVISIDNSRANHNGSREQLLPHRQLQANDYARTLASAAHSLNSTSCNNWQSNHNKSTDSAYHAAVVKHDYMGDDAAFTAHNDYDYTADRVYEQHALDAYVQRSDCHKVEYTTRARDVHPASSHSSSHAMASPPVESTPVSVYCSDRSALLSSHRYSTEDSNGTAYYPEERGRVSGYEGQTQTYQYSPHHNQTDVHSDYGSVDELSPPYRSPVANPTAANPTAANPPAANPTAANPPADDGSEALIKSITNVYWQLTEDIRDAVGVMEDVIATGTTHKFLPLCNENLPSLWKWLMDSVVYYNNVMTKFCMMCPLIATMCSAADKKILIQHSYISVWLVWNSPLFKNGQSYIPFRSSNAYVYTRNWMQKILPTDFVEYIHEYATRQNAARFSVSEIALLCCLALTPANVAGINNPEAVSQLHRTFNELLTKEICKTRVNPKEMLNEVPQLLELLKIAVIKQGVILQFDHHNPPDLSFD